MKKFMSLYFKLFGGNYNGKIYTTKRPVPWQGFS